MKLQIKIGFFGRLSIGLFLWMFWAPLGLAQEKASPPGVDPELVNAMVRTIYGQLGREFKEIPGRAKNPNVDVGELLGLEKRERLRNLLETLYQEGIRKMHGGPNAKGSHDGIRLAGHEQIPPEVEKALRTQINKKLVEKLQDPKEVIADLGPSTSGGGDTADEAEEKAKQRLADLEAKKKEREAALKEKQERERDRLEDARRFLRDQQLYDRANANNNPGQGGGSGGAGDGGLGGFGDGSGGSGFGSEGDGASFEPGEPSNHGESFEKALEGLSDAFSGRDRPTLPLSKFDSSDFGDSDDEESPFGDFDFSSLTSSEDDSNDFDLSAFGNDDADFGDDDVNPDEGEEGEGDLADFPGGALGPGIDPAGLGAGSPFGGGGGGLPALSSSVGNSLGLDPSGGAAAGAGASSGGLGDGAGFAGTGSNSQSILSGSFPVLDADMAGGGGGGGGGSYSVVQTVGFESATAGTGGEASSKGAPEGLKKLLGVKKAQATRFDSTVIQRIAAGLAPPSGNLPPSGSGLGKAMGQVQFAIRSRGRDAYEVAKEEEAAPYLKSLGRKKDESFFGASFLCNYLNCRGRETRPTS